MFGSPRHITAMQCQECQAALEIMRSCGRIRMKCTKCGHQYQIHEVADQLDEATEEILGRWNVIIYD